jgi:uncharacterized membrane protein
MSIQTPARTTPATTEEAVRRTELIISNLLRWGVAISIMLVLMGTCVTFAHHPAYLTSADELTTLKTSQAFPTSLPALARGLAAGEGRAIVMLGLVVLLATPIARVAASIVAFWHQRDVTFVVITSMVMAMLLVSLTLGKAGG